MNSQDSIADLQIAEQAEIELWGDIRMHVRRRLFRAATVGAFSMVLSLAVGAFLLTSVSGLGDGIADFTGDRNQAFDLTWMVQLAWAYGFAAATVVVLYVIVLLSLRNWLPSVFSPVPELIPAIGPTIRAVSLGEFCQTVYLSVVRSETYENALRRASETVGNPALRRWAGESQKMLAAGRSIEQVLTESPVSDHPLNAVSATLCASASDEMTRQVWWQATTECHELANSRMHRTIQILSVFCLSVSALSASLALSFSVYLLSQSLSYFMYF